MTDNIGFFRWVWRFNALALACVALLAAAGIGYQAWRSFHHSDYDKPAGEFTPVPRVAEQNATYRIEDAPYGFGNLVLTAGSSRERLLSLRRWEGSPQSYGLADVVAPRAMNVIVGGMDAVNLLIMDVDTGKSRWMFSGYKRRVMSGEPLYATEPSLAVLMGNTEVVAPAAVGVVLRVVDDFSEDDPKANEKRPVSLYYYRTGMTKPSKFLTATLVVSTRQIGADKYQVVYERGPAAYAATYSVADFKLLSQEPLPKVPN